MADKFPKLVKRNYFSKVKEARELLQSQARVYLRLHKRNIKEAMLDGDHETAAKAIQWALEHVTDDDGSTPISPSVDIPRPSAGNMGPIINVGFQIGGLAKSLAVAETTTPSVEALTLPLIDIPALPEHSGES